MFFGLEVLHQVVLDAQGMYLGIFIIVFVVPVLVSHRIVFHIRESNTTKAVALTEVGLQGNAVPLVAAEIATRVSLLGLRRRLNPSILADQLGFRIVIGADLIQHTIRHITVDIM